MKLEQIVNLRNVQVSTDFTKLKIGTYTTDTYVSVSGRDISRFLIVPDAYEESSLCDYRGGASRDFARVKAIFTPGSIQNNGFITAPRTKAYLLCTNGNGENPEDLTMEKICKYSVYYIS